MERPWVEKYRPTAMGDIVLSRYNSTIIDQVTSNNLRINMLLYGPPGTGKTTTALNVIESLKSREPINAVTVMHLNASDDRGIDIIRTQLNSFVRATNMFAKGQKIVVMDEADYLTKFAQNALKYIIDETIANVQFILICNYITRIDKSLQNIFLKIRFDSLPRSGIFQRLRHICDCEGVAASSSELFNVIDYYDADVRSMINHLQFNRSDLQDTIVTVRTFNRLARAARFEGAEGVRALVPSNIYPRDFWSSVYFLMVREHDYALSYVPSIREVTCMDVDDERWGRAASALFAQIVRAQPSPCDSLKGA